MNDQAKGLLAIAGVTALYLATKSKGGDFKTEAIDKIANDAAVVAAENKWRRDDVLTQAMHESDWLRSALTRQANNLYGFKTGEAWDKAGKPYVTLPTQEFIGGKWVRVQARFRAYPSFLESMRDWARLISTVSRYADTKKALDAHDSKAYFLAIGKSGYATDPNYGTKLASVYGQIESLVV